MLFKIDVLKNFAIFAKKHLCWSLFWIKLQAFRAGCKLGREAFWPATLCSASWNTGSKDFGKIKMGKTNISKIAVKRNYTHQVHDWKNCTIGLSHFWYLNWSFVENKSYYLLKVTLLLNGYIFLKVCNFVKK